MKAREKQHVTPHRSPRRPTGAGAGTRAGFTVLELLVVLGIAALIGAITLGGFSQMAAGQKRTTCQTNLTQLYQAARLYQADYNAFPAFYPDRDPDEQGAGLWTLYAFPDPLALNRLSLPSNEMYTGYLKNRNSMHCPEDRDALRADIIDSSTGLYNPNFLSYQIEDPDSGQWTYRPLRTTSTGNPHWKRQLEPSVADGADADTFEDKIAVPPANDTVVTWCPWHRTVMGGRENDNVLFYDGSVQLLPRIDSDGYSGWQRSPKTP